MVSEGIWKVTPWIGRKLGSTDDGSWNTRRAIRWYIYAVQIDDESETIDDAEI